MDRSPRRSPIIGPLALALALAVGCGTGQEEGGAGSAAGAEPGGTFGTQPDAGPAAIEEPLIQLRYEGGLIKNPDPTPFVRVYPGGRVLIHYPAYMKQAGDYELLLDEAELQELLSSFADREVLTTESDELEAMVARVRAQEQLLAPPDDHGVTTVVEIQADSFTEAGREDPTLLEIDRTLTARSLPSPEDLDVVADPELRRLQLFARGVRDLEALAERPDLEPVEPSETDPAGGRNDR